MKPLWRIFVFFASLPPPPQPPGVFLRLVSGKSREVLAEAFVPGVMGQV